MGHGAGVAHEAAAKRAGRGGAESAARQLSAEEEERKGEGKALTCGAQMSVGGETHAGRGAGLTAGLVRWAGKLGRGVVFWAGRRKEKEAGLGHHGVLG